MSDRIKETSARLESVDLVRGLVMLVMGLDHTREFFTNLRFQPEDLSRSFPALFFTRWITHFCAPAFFFLAGTGAYLSLARGKSVADLSSFLWRRGLWLVILDLTLVDFIFTFSWHYQVGIVLWALGWSMVVLALAVRLPVRVIAGISITIILLHNTLDKVDPKGLPLQVIFELLHRPIITTLANGHVIGALYPLVPWIAVMALGFAFGHAYTLQPADRKKLFGACGVVTTVAFVTLRATNWYGEPRLWGQKSSVLMTVCSFLNCTKYPPSLCFLLMTLGPLLILLAACEREIPRALRPALIYGRVPLFFFVGHLLLVHLLAVVVALITRQPVSWLFHGAVLTAVPPTYGHHLGFIYLVWAVAMIIMYPICLWYAGVKRTSRHSLLSYL
ncbi:MAG: hypothetical protein JWO13_363 [Acidobacteriales bacterium]|nr:hypothetical protein [Terriglobales bacterium]